ncbi:hypothetical protein ACFV3E_36820 [Streptomyces sp. NPDC059718]
MDRPFYAPYIDAVVAELGRLASPNVWYARFPEGGGPSAFGATILLLDGTYDAEEDRTISTELRWSPLTGWSWAYVCSDGAESISECLLAALVPPPDHVALAAVHAAVYDEDYLPVAGCDSPALSYLPAEVVQAVKAGVVTEAVALQLASYV